MGSRAGPVRVGGWRRELTITSGVLGAEKVLVQTPREFLQKIMDDRRQAAQTRLGLTRSRIPPSSLGSREAAPALGAQPDDLTLAQLELLHLAAGGLDPGLLAVAERQLDAYLEAEMDDAVDHRLGGAV